jgi:hypothetical protein
MIPPDELGSQHGSSPSPSPAASRLRTTSSPRLRNALPTMPPTYPLPPGIAIFMAA